VFHVSEERDIEWFEPRTGAGFIRRDPSGRLTLDTTSDTSAETIPVVWAIDGERLRNYLLPRDCPRVTYYAGPKTTATDRDQFLGFSAAVVAIERSWLERLRRCRLYCYHLPPDTFECADECAGYFVSRVSVQPTFVEVIDDAIAALVRRRVELRVLPSLWPLRDAVIESSLQFSIIRMRNAHARIAE
jgi:uncharacterized protein DUF6886